jgi:hypothetical protein
VDFRLSRVGVLSSLFTAAGTAIHLASCAAPTSYMGISLKPGAAPLGLQALAGRAQAGDKRAQLDLGIAFEEGILVLQDFVKAKLLYKLAATDDGGPMWVYVPPVNGSRGRVLAVGNRPVNQGIVEARKRLSTLKVRR